MYSYLLLKKGGNFQPAMLVYQTDAPVEVRGIQFGPGHHLRGSCADCMPSIRLK